MEKYLPNMTVVIIIFMVGALVSFMTMLLLFKKKSRIKIIKDLGIIIALALFILGPAWNDVYMLVRNKGYLTLKNKYATLLTAFSDKTTILAVRPLYFLPYYPEHPLAEGQRKAYIVAEIKIKNKRLANKIKIKFDIDDGAGRRIDSEMWDVIAKQKSLIFSMFYPDVKFITWTPDIPNGIEAIAKDRQKPFKLWLIVTWEDIDKKGHKLESYSELRYDEQLKLYYFDERENKLLY